MGGNAKTMTKALEEHYDDIQGHIDNTVVEMSAEALVERIARAHKQPMPPTEHFYKLALERSAEIKRGENLEN